MTGWGVLASGVLLELVWAALRRSSIRMTADAYAKVAADAKRQALTGKRAT